LIERRLGVATTSTLIGQSGGKFGNNDFRPQKPCNCNRHRFAVKGMGSIILSFPFSQDQPSNGLPQSAYSLDPQTWAVSTLLKAAFWLVFDPF
jgi:hypothetical protein